MKTRLPIIISLIAILLALITMLAGCTEEKKWGKGELPADYVSFFGDDNGARLNKAQNDMLNRHQAILHGLDTKDGHANGLVDYYNMLNNRVAALEAVDPNEIANINTRIGDLEDWTHNPNAIEYRY